MLAIKAHVGYFITPSFHYYGVVGDDHIRIVIGPAVQTRSTDSELRKLAFECDVPSDEVSEFVAAMNSIVHMPLESILQILCGQIRQSKNTFIVTATLVSRAAIRGGMDIDDAFSLSDAYIQKCELSDSVQKITNLQYRMVLNYTERVEKLRRGGHPSKFVLDVTNYILHHISEPVTTEEIAKALFMSRSRLSVKFKKRQTRTSSTLFSNRKPRKQRVFCATLTNPSLLSGIILHFPRKVTFPVSSNNTADVPRTNTANDTIPLFSRRILQAI